MTEDQSMQMLWAVGALVLVGSAFFAHRVPIGRAAKMALAWIAIFAIAMVIVTFRNDVKTASQRVWAELVGGGQAEIDGETLRIRKSDDGHFWVNASINGHQERFLIDSGATVIALSVGAAARSGVEPGMGYPMMMSTANGMIAADRATVGRLDVGPIRRDEIAVVIAEEFGGMNVLGMNFLSSLRSWSVEGDWLILRS